jgi:hypothetical protein
MSANIIMTRSNILKAAYFRSYSAIEIGLKLDYKLSHLVIQISRIYSQNSCQRHQSKKTYIYLFYPARSRK